MDVRSRDQDLRKVWEREEGQPVLAQICPYFKSSNLLSSKWYPKKECWSLITARTFCLIFPDVVYSHISSTYN